MNAARGSDDEYCSAYPLERHHYISQSVSAAPIRWVEICSLCRHVSSSALRKQIVEGEAKVAEIQADPAQPHYGG